MKIVQRLAKFIQKESDHLNPKMEKEKLLEEISNNQSLSIDTLERICMDYPQLNPVWLVTGKGEMLIDDYHEVGKAIENVESKDGIYNVIAGKDIEIQLLKEHIEGLNALILVKNKLIEEYRKI